MELQQDEVGEAYQWHAIAAPGCAAKERRLPRTPSYDDVDHLCAAGEGDRSGQGVVVVAPTDVDCRGLPREGFPEAGA